MTFRIAHRISGRTTIQCDHRGETFLKIGQFYDHTYLDDEKALVLSPGTASICDTPKGTYGRSDMTRAVSFNCLPDRLPSFQVNEAEFDLIDDMLIWHRPPVWALDWTTRRPKTGAREVAAHGFDVRLASAKRNRHELTEVIRRVPTWARDAIGTNLWCEIVAKYAPQIKQRV